jgi:phage tail sheath protein FI
MSNHLDLHTIGKNLSGGIHAPTLPPGATITPVKIDPAFPESPVNRLALFVEQSLKSSLQWTAFERNNTNLWSSIASAADDYMNELFRQGRFQGTTPQTAYFVKCDATTTTQTDINNGVVNIVVGFAPLKPAEFVVISIPLLAASSSNPLKPPK